MITQPFPCIKTTFVGGHAPLWFGGKLDWARSIAHCARSFRLLTVLVSIAKRFGIMELLGQSDFDRYARSVRHSRNKPVPHLRVQATSSKPVRFARSRRFLTDEGAHFVPPRGVRS